MLGNMPQITGNDKEDILALYDQYIALRKELTDTLFNLDSENIREINAEIVNVYNLNADNIVAGTIDADVIDVVNINADNITAGTLTGITIQTGTSGKNRIVLNVNGIRSYNSSNQLHGMYFDPSASDADFSLYYHGDEYFKVKRYGNGISLSSSGQTFMYYNNAYQEVWANESWDFTGANTIGLGTHLDYDSDSGELSLLDDDNNVLSKVTI